MDSWERNGFYFYIFLIVLNTILPPIFMFWPSSKKHHDRDLYDAKTAPTVGGVVSWVLVSLFLDLIFAILVILMTHSTLERIDSGSGDAVMFVIVDLFFIGVTGFMVYLGAAMTRFKIRELRGSRKQN